MPGNPYTTGLPDSLAVALGSPTRVPLRAALGSGYGWTVEVEGGAVEASVRTVGADSPGAPPPLSAARQLLEISGRRAGSAQLRIRLARPWATDRPIAEHTVRVTVADATPG
jgi:hypothetical protein